MLSDEGSVGLEIARTRRLTIRTRPGFAALSYPVAKRLIDILSALLLGLLILPVLLPLVLLIRLDGGSPLYSQQRLGRGGRAFRFWKLRTMVPDAEQALARHLAANPEAKREWDSAQKLRRDPRVTPIGRILRKYSVDELPQLWNVLVGDMSLIGPRPMFLEQRGLYPGIPYCDLRPGITGLWQVTDRNRCAFAERARFDRLYAERLSLRTDVWIALRTVCVIFRGTGC